MEKQCVKCRVSRPITKFRAYGNGHRATQCRLCFDSPTGIAPSDPLIPVRRRQRRQYLKLPDTATEHWCGRCGSYRPFAEFTKTQPNTCRDCVKERNRRWRQENPGYYQGRRRWLGCAAPTIAEVAKGGGATLVCWHCDVSVTIEEAVLEEAVPLRTGRARSHTTPDDWFIVHPNCKMIWCSMCDRLLPQGDFYWKPSGCHQAGCKSCRSRYGAHKYRADPIGHTERSRNYARAHPEMMRKHAYIRITRRRAAAMGVEHDGTEREAIIERDGPWCYLCGCEVAPADIHIDHVIPLSRGGSHTADNLAVAHSFCNQSKKDKTPEEYWAWSRDVLSQDLTNENCVL